MGLHLQWLDDWQITTLSSSTVERSRTVITIIFSGLVKKNTYHTSGKVTSLMTSQWRHGWVMTSHANFRDDSITPKAGNDITISTGTTIPQTSS